jgi:hypothetical protein
MNLARVLTLDAIFKEVESSHNENRTNLHYLFLVFYVLKKLQYGLCYQIATVIRTGSAVFEAILTSTTRANSIVINKNVQKSRRVARLIIMYWKCPNLY